MSRERRRNAGLDNVDNVNGRNKRTCRKLDSLCTRKSRRDQLLRDEDTHVAMVEKAPHRNEELMVVSAKEVRCQYLCVGLSVSVNKSCS
jgi:hypothetical protein